ncbi:hypothetical protein H3H37_10525 [Duganella sp. LX20W]|uniref:Uncharacterized protein n=1 Tax=Rugamonas brunnea TaxID=2758569 RepID=A0A7W2ERW6_9BURK|nr:hypothetical protein [Rugamonas brunnea]MBA5637488.1 hypothetical protein [Rugamonas brunnea]
MHSAAIHAHRAPDPAPVDDPVPEPPPHQPHPVPQDDPVPDHNPAALPACAGAAMPRCQMV